MATYHQSKSHCYRAWYVLSKLKTSLLLYPSGTNDEINDIPFDHFTSTLKKFIQKLTTTFPSVKEIWLIVRFATCFFFLKIDSFPVQPPFEDYSEEDRSEYRKSMLLERSNDVPSLQFFTDVPVFICDVQDSMKEEFTVDGLHPTASGQEILATNFAAFVKARGDVS